jgi:tRNA pseudouridine55 synthase
MSSVSLADVRRAAEGLTGPILQVPPRVSAVKVGGKRLHELARAGVEVEREARPVTVHRFEVAATAEPSVFAVEVECSSGTYIRTLAADLGTALGGGAHLRNLRRTAIGSFTLADAGPLSTAGVLTPAQALRDYPSVVIDAEARALVSHGRPVPGLPDGTVGLLDVDGDLVAVYEDGRPSVVLAPA